MNLLREDGMAKADAAQPTDWKLAVDARIAELAATGQPFTVEDVVAVTGPSPTGSKGAAGARFTANARWGVIRRAGFAQSPRQVARQHVLSVWVGAA